MQSFGGKSSSSGAESGATINVSTREVGELALVPQNYSNPNFVDTGSYVSQSDYPDLYAKLTDSAVGSNWTQSNPVPGTAAYEALGSKAIAACKHGTGIGLMLRGGVYVTSPDGLNFVFAGKLPEDSVIKNYNLYTSGTVVSDGTKVLFVAKVLGYACAYGSSDGGVTWVRVTDAALLNVVSKASLAAYSRDFMFDGTSYYLINPTDKTIAKSSDMFTWSETPIATPTAIPTSSFWTYNATAGCITVVSTTRAWASLDKGATWLEATFAPTGSTLSNVLYNPTDGRTYIASWATGYQYIYSAPDGLNYTKVATLTASAANCQYLLLTDTYMVLCSGYYVVNSKAFYAARATPTTWGTPTGPSIASPSNVVYTFGSLICFPQDASTAPLCKIAYLTTPVVGTALYSATVYNSISTVPTFSGRSATDGNVVVALLTPPVAGTKEFRWTDDGVTWNVGNFPFVAMWSDVAWDEVAQTFVACSTTAINGDNRNFGISSDGKTWSTYTAKYPCLANYLLVTDNYVMFMLGGSGVGNEVIARQGTTQVEYAQQVSSQTPFIEPISDGSTVLVSSTSTTGQLYAITDGNLVSTNVTKTLPGSLSAATVCAASPSTVVFATGATAYYCVDKSYTTWTTVTLPIAATWAAMVYVGGTFILIPKTGSAGLVSPDGITWTLFMLQGLLPTTTVVGAVVFKGQVLLLTSAGVPTYKSSASSGASRWVPKCVTGVAGSKYIVRAK